jgi:hypothetical protein
VSPGLPLSAERRHCAVAAPLLRSPFISVRNRPVVFHRVIRQPWRELISPATTVDPRRSGSPAKVAGQNYDRGGRKRKSGNRSYRSGVPKRARSDLLDLKDTNSAGSSANFGRPTNRPAIGCTPAPRQWERREHRVRSSGRAAVHRRKEPVSAVARMRETECRS